MTEGAHSGDDRREDERAVDEGRYDERHADRADDQRDPSPDEQAAAASTTGEHPRQIWAVPGVDHAGYPTDDGYPPRTDYAAPHEDWAAAEYPQSPHLQSPQDYAQAVQQYFDDRAAAPGASAPQPVDYPIAPLGAEQPASSGWAPQPAAPQASQAQAPAAQPATEHAAPPHQHPVEQAPQAPQQVGFAPQTGYPPQDATAQPGGYPPQGYPVPPAAQYAQAPQQVQQPVPGYGAPAPDQGYAAQQPFQAPPEPPRMPAPEDLLVPTESRVDIEPASWGWRGRMNRVSGGLLKTKAAPGELEARQAIKRIQRSFSRPMTVVVVQPKGGAGKTPTTVCLSAAFGAHRGGYVVGWDDNETRGTLAVRVANPDKQQATVWDLLSDLPTFERHDARVGDLSFYVRAQPDAHFDALVSDDNPANMAQIGEEAFQRLHTVLQRFYRVIVVDTGNNVRSPNWQAAVNAADLVVAVSTYQRDVGYSASWVLDHLAQTGREELARNAVTVLTAADPTIDKEVRDQLVGHFTARTRAVVEIPYDTELAHGGSIRWSHMKPATRNAWVQAGATVVDALAEHDARTLAARRS